LWTGRLRIQPGPGASAQVRARSTSAIMPKRCPVNARSRLWIVAQSEVMQSKDRLPGLLRAEVARTQDPVGPPSHRRRGGICRRSEGRRRPRYRGSTVRRGGRLDPCTDGGPPLRTPRARSRVPDRSRADGIYADGMHLWQLDPGTGIVLWRQGVPLINRAEARRIRKRNPSSPLRFVPAWAAWPWLRRSRTRSCTEPGRADIGPPTRAASPVAPRPAPASPA
jgi:hypothetical protein